MSKLEKAFSKAKEMRRSRLSESHLQDGIEGERPLVKTVT